MLLLCYNHLGMVNTTIPPNKKRSEDEQEFSMHTHIHTLYVTTFEKARVTRATKMSVFVQRQADNACQEVFFLTANRTIISLRMHINFMHKYSAIHSQSDLANSILLHRKDVMCSGGGGGRALACVCTIKMVYSSGFCSSSTYGRNESTKALAFPKSSLSRISQWSV